MRGINIQPSDRISCDQQSWIQVDFSAKNNLLNISTRQLTHSMKNTRSLNIKLLNDRVSFFPGYLALQHWTLVEGVVF